MMTLPLGARAINGRDIALPLLKYAENARVRALPHAAWRLAAPSGLSWSTACVVAQAAVFNLEAGQ